MITIKELLKSQNSDKKLIYHGSDNNVYLYSLPYGKYILREALRTKSDTDLFFEREFSNFLYKKNIPVRKIIDNMDKFTLLSYCNGDSLSVNDLNSEKAFNGGLALANFHKVATEYLLNTKVIPTRKITDELERALVIKDKIISKFIDGDEFIKYVEQMIKSEYLHNLDNCIIHNDFRVQNVLFENNRISAVLDFDWACMGNKLKDLGHSLAEWSYPDGGEFNRDLFISFWNGYNSVYQNINIYELKFWIMFGCLSDTATYITDRIDSFESGGKILSWMYGKYLFFCSQDIAKLSE